MSRRGGRAPHRGRPVQRAPQVPAAVRVEDEFDDVIGELSQLSRNYLLLFRIEVGRVLATRFFRADEAAYRDPRSNKESSFRRFVVERRTDLADLGLGGETVLRQSLLVWFAVQGLPKELVDELFFSHVVELARIEDRDARLEMAQAAVANDWSSRDLAEVVSGAQSEPTPEAETPQPAAAPEPPPQPSFVVKRVETMVGDAQRLLAEWGPILTRELSAAQRARVSEAIRSLQATLAEFESVLSS